MHLRSLVRVAVSLLAALLLVQPVLADSRAKPKPTPTATPATPPPSSGNPHSTITEYNGPETCVQCHATQAQDALHSEHMQWEGKWQQVNTYCTSPAPADYACLSCHASTGKVTNQTANDVDCLVCHNDTYKRSLQPLDIPVTVVDWQGNSKTYNTPSKNAEGNYTMQPRFDLMPPGTTMVSLAQNVHLPTRRHMSALSRIRRRGRWRQARRHEQRQYQPAAHL